MIFDSDEMPNVFHVLYTGSKEDTRGTMIEKYFDDFKHVKIIPFKEIIKKIRQNSEYLYGKDIYEYTNFLSDNIFPDENFVTGTGSEISLLVNEKYRRIIKMQWLINDIVAEGCHEPINATITINLHHNGLNEYSMQIHPGSFRKHAFKLMERNDLCIVYDAFHIFPQKKASLKDILDLYNDVETNLEISLFPNERTLNTPQIVNQHHLSKNVNMVKNLRGWEEKVRDLWNKPINIFVGYDSTHKGSSESCKASIEKNIGSKLNSYIKIHDLDVSKIDGWTREYKDQSTEFSYSRFLVPYLSNYEGMSIFCDDDFIFNDNILNLLFFIAPQYSVACVKHNFSKKYDTKFTNAKDVWYDKKLWSSLMVFNNSHPDCKKLTLESVQRETGKYLHQFEWTTDECIASLPDKWNWCEGYSDVADIHDALGLHWTRGGPWIDDMDCSGINGLHLYDAYSQKENTGWKQIIDIRQYYDIDNPIEILEDGTYLCQEINSDVR